MIFFVDHDAKGLPPIHDDRATGALGSMLATDEMPFYQDLPVQRRQVLQAFRKRLLHLRKRFHARPDQFQNRTAFGLLRPTRKRPVAQIACEPYSAANYDLVMRPFAAQPFSSSGQHIRNFHVDFESSFSSCLISSRNEAAVS